MTDIVVGTRGEFRMWNQDPAIPGIIESTHVTRSTGDTRVIFKRDGYRETYNIDAEKFLAWFIPDFDALDSFIDARWRNS